VAVVLIERDIEVVQLREKGGTEREERKAGKPLPTRRRLRVFPGHSVFSLGEDTGLGH
jgi:hypothetical protein